MRGFRISCGSLRAIPGLSAISYPSEADEIFALQAVGWVPTIPSQPLCWGRVSPALLRERQFAPPAAPEGQPLPTNTLICDGDPLTERVVLSESAPRWKNKLDRRSVADR